jgi:hypothetical protein
MCAQFRDIVQASAMILNEISLNAARDQPELIKLLTTR